MSTTLLSKKYPGLPIQRMCVLYGVALPSLEDFVAIMKMDEELTLEPFLKMFPDDPDGYDKDVLIQAFNSVAPLQPKDIFSAKFGNVEVRAAILKYTSPEKVFEALEGKVIDTWETFKKYPKLKIVGIEGHPDSHRITEKNIHRSTTTRYEKYELIEIDHPTLRTFLPYGERSIVLLKMTCPSSKKIYYEYIDPAIFDRRKPLAKAFDLLAPGGKVKLALCWQMERIDHEPITFDQYKNIFSET